MADKSIVELGVAQQMTDDALLPVYQGGETKAIEGAAIKKYARESTKQFVEGAAQSAQDAAQSAEAAKTAREGVEAYAEQAGQSAAQAAGSAKTAQDAATSAEASKTAAAGSETAAQKSADEAKSSETAAGLSETNAGKSATAAQAAKTSAEAAQKAAEAAKAAAESSATLAGEKATAASQKATEASGSAAAAAGAATAAEKSKTDAEAAKTAAQTAQSAAEKAKTASESAKTAAQTAQGKAEDARDAAGVSAASAANSATAANSSATAAAGSASTASAKAGEAAGSAATAENAKTTAESAKDVAVAAKTDAENAMESAVAAKTASESARDAAVAAKSGAETARDAAKSSETAAKKCETAAKASETSAATSAATATAQAGTATTKAGEAATSAGAAKTSETNAKTSETAAGESADAAEQARQAIEALGVQGVTLAPGSQVAVEKVVAADGTVTLKFSIPQGAKGDKGNKGDQGVSITSIRRTAGTGAAGTTDTYTITLSDGSTSTFAVYNGRDGEGAGDMLANVYDPQNKAQDVFAYTDTSIADLPIKRLVGTDAAPINLDDLREPGIYYITGTQTTTIDACGLLDSDYLQSPLVVIGNTQRRHSKVGAGLRGRAFVNGMTIKIPPMDFMFKDKGVLTNDIDMGTHKITNLPVPTADADAATKGYVDTAIAGLPVKRLVGTANAPIDIDALTEPGRYYLAGETVSSTATEDIWDTLAMYLAAGTPIDVIAVEEASMVRQTIPLCDGEPGSAASRLLEGGAFGAFDVYCAARDGHTHTAKQVAFADGETFQQKLDAGKLKGADGTSGKDGTNGKDGVNGKDGKSAYQQAIEAGYTGTEAAFYAALVTLKDAPFLPLAGGQMTDWLRAPAIVFDNNSYICEAGDGTGAIELRDEGDGPICLRGVSAPTAADDAANKDYVDKKTLVFQGKAVATTAWAADTTYSAQGYGFRAAIACTGVTTSHRPDVAFSAADAVGGNFAPVADSYAGGVYIYCKEKPTTTVTIPSIVCIKGA